MYKLLTRACTVLGEHQHKRNLNSWKSTQLLGLGVECLGFNAGAFIVRVGFCGPLYSYILGTPVVIEAPTVGSEFGAYRSALTVELFSQTPVPFARSGLHRMLLHAPALYIVYKLPRGSIVVPFGGSYLESYKVIPKRNYYGAYG